MKSVLVLVLLAALACAQSSKQSSADLGIVLKV
jgi:hypothetical protein